MTLRKSLPPVLSSLCALVALIAAPAASAAGNVATGSACYAAEGNEGVNVDVTGSGFTPGEAVFAQIPAPGGLAGFAEATIAPDGTFSATVEHVFPGGIDPVVEGMQMQVMGVLSSQILAESSFQITNLGVATKPSTAPYSKKVKYTFAGFRSGAPIFGHYFRHNKLVLNHKFGKATGACGTLDTKAKLFPGNGPKSAKYKVQFDDSKKVNPKAAPKFVTSLAPAF